MTDTKLPLIHKAPVEELKVHVARTGLVIGDTAEVGRLSDGRIGVYARTRRPLFGLVPRRRRTLLGQLGPLAEDMLFSVLEQGADLRIRIVDLVPEHLANGYPPEIYVSVWGSPRHLSSQLGLCSIGLETDRDDVSPDPPRKAQLLPRLRPA